MQTTPYCIWFEGALKITWDVKNHTFKKWKALQFQSPQCEEFIVKQQDYHESQNRIKTEHKNAEYVCLLGHHTVKLFLSLYCITMQNGIDGEGDKLCVVTCKM
jgi:hypothetical protein